MKRNVTLSILLIFLTFSCKASNNMESSMQANIKTSKGDILIKLEFEI